MKKGIIIFLLIAGLIIGLVFFLYYQNNHVIISKISIAKDGINPFRIVHLSDLHGKQFGEKNAVLNKKIVELNPDLIVFTGDIIDRSGENFDDTVDFIGTLNKQVPVVCIPGNHEWGSGLRNDLIQDFKDKSISILENEIFTLEINGNQIHILGIDEMQYTRADKRSADISFLFTELLAEPGYKIVLSHFPENYALSGDASYNQYDFDVMFSGHAHGGQFILPFVGGVYSPGQRFNPQYYKGLYDNRLIVSAGLGNSGFPFRLFNYPEIVEVEIS